VHRRPVPQRTVALSSQEDVRLWDGSACNLSGSIGALVGRMTVRTRGSCQSLRATVLLIFLFVAIGVVAASRSPKVSLARSVYTLHSSAGDASLPIELSHSWGTVHLEVTKAVIVFHGKGHNVEGYFAALKASTEQAGQQRTTVLIAPQFLSEDNFAALHLPDHILRWEGGSWSAGFPASAPVPLSTFDVIDALLRDLGTRSNFPNLTTVVLVGHSGGGQLLNRYAIVSTYLPTLSAAGIHVRIVIANPSSYLYFSDDRPATDGSFAQYNNASCPHFNHWRYGTINPPQYVVDRSEAAWRAREAAYASADVIYLLGSEDTNPAEQDLDTSCSGKAQGSERLERGRAYFRYLRARDGQEFGQRLLLVPGVAHVGARMINSPCGRAAIFGVGSCGSERSAEEHH